MPKKIDSALKDLVKALTKHAEVAGDSKSSRSKVQRASAKVRAAATNYGSIVSARSGTDSPFSDIPNPQLDQPTVESLKAERDSLRKRSDENSENEHEGNGSSSNEAATDQPSEATADQPNEATNDQPNDAATDQTTIAL